MAYKTFQQALEELRKLLYKNELYREGQVSIIYDKNDKDFYIAEFPLKSNVYIANHEIDMLNVDIEQLDEMYDDAKRENDTEDIDFSDIVDNYLDTAEQEQIYDEKVELVN